MRVTVVQKLSKLEVLQRDHADRVDALAQHNPAALEPLQQSAELQREANHRVTDALSEAGFEVVAMHRDVFAGPADGSVLVVAVGGDGTVLDVSHNVIDVPLLGVNSDPARSTGYFCGTDVAGLRETAVRWASGATSSTMVRRIGLEVDAVRYAFPCMNDVLITNSNPAMMSRYVVTAGPRSEAQASSGVWVSTPAGSTAGIRSAGGTVLPLDGDLIQYLVREPYLTGSARYELLRGVRHLHEGIAFESQMEGGAVYVDGPYLQIPFPIGSTLRMARGPSLELVAMDPLRRER
jgi:NAD+ kinase